MTNYVKGIIAVLFSAAWLSGVMQAQAWAEPILEQRCNTDSLDARRAEARLDWMWHCAQFRSGYERTFTIDGLREYLEDSGASGLNSYTGTIAERGINSTYVFTLYSRWGDVAEDDVRGRKKWQKARNYKKPRPLYPTYGTSPIIDQSTQLFPHPTNPYDCSLYLDQNGTRRHNGAFYVNGWCESSCYTPEQEILFADGYRAIGEAIKKLVPSLVTLTSDSTLDDLHFQDSDVHSYTSEIFDSEHIVIELTMGSGGQLRVTPEHPVIISTGQVVQAKSLRLGDSLIRSTGELDPVISIVEATHWGKVYNIKPVNRDLVSNILIAQGYLVGSATFQNDAVGYINRIILGRAIPAEILPQ